MQNRATPFRLPTGVPGFAVLCLALLCAVPTAGAQFDAYAWTLVNPDGPASVVGDHMHIESTPGGFGHLDAHFVTTAPVTGTFAVDVQSDSSGGFGIGAYTIRNGVKKPICKSCVTTATLDVQAGDSFGFGMESIDFSFGIASVDYTNLVFTAAPLVTSITSTHSWLQEDVVISGSGFDAETTVHVDGVPVPVLSWTPTELVIAPGPHAPGFADVRVTNGNTAPTIVPDGLAFLPTLSASDADLGGTLSVEIDSGAPGAYLLVFGLQGLPAPLPAANAYFGLLLDPASLLGLSVSGALSGSESVQLDFPLPELAVLAGVPLHMQVLAAQGGAPGGVTASFTNSVLRVLTWPEVSVLTVLSKPAPAHADDFGQALAALGDVDGDGVPDLAVGAPGGNEAGVDSGSVRVISGASGATRLTLHGSAAGDRFGSSVSGIADMDGDGVPDFVVGASGAGVVTLHSGSDGAVLATLPFPNVVVAGLADFDGDGVPEIGIGNGTYITSSVLICSGATGEILREHTAPEGHALGASLAALGDVNLDGTPDYVVGAPRSGCSASSRSYARVHSGLDGAMLHEFIADGCHKLGTSVGDAGDVNLDGWPDIIAGAPVTSLGFGVVPGYARVFSGKDGEILREFTGAPPALNHLFDLASEHFGAAVGNARDVNGDGVPDQLVGVPFKGSNPITTLGAVRVYSGAFGTLLAEVSGASPGAWMGTSVVGLGDLDGDGYADFAGGAPRELNDTIKSGGVVIWSGHPQP